MLSSAPAWPHEGDKLTLFDGDVDTIHRERCRRLSEAHGSSTIESLTSFDMTCAFSTLVTVSAVCVTEEIRRSRPRAPATEAINNTASAQAVPMCPVSASSSRMYTDATVVSGDIRNTTALTVTMPAMNVYRSPPRRKNSSAAG